MVLTQFLLILAIISSTSLQNIRPDYIDQEDLVQGEVDYDYLLERLINTLERLLDYFFKESQYINLDGVVGLRMVQGQLKILLRRLDYTSDSTETKHIAIRTTIENYEKLAQIYKKAQQIAEDAIPFVAKHSSEYYGRMNSILSPPIWEIDYRTRVTDESLIYETVMPSETLNETASDACIRNMLNSNCKLEDWCWVEMTSPSWIGYSLTHQIIYLITGEQSGCGKEMQEIAMKHGQTSTWHLINVMCANVVKEMKETYAKGMPELYQDLFMEQAAICGMLGFQDSFAISWLNEIISWQRADGCYGSDNTQVYLASVLQMFIKKMPSKREEKILQGGCLSHKTAVAAGALAVYARYVIESQALSIYGPPILEK